MSASHTSDLGVGDGTAATPSAVKKAYDDGTRQGDADTFGQVKLTDSLTSTSCASAHVGLSACAGKQLKDLIDQIIGPDDPDDPGTSDARKAIYDLVVKNFELVTVSDTIVGGTYYLLAGDLVFPKVANKRMDAEFYAVSAVADEAGEGQGTFYQVSKGLTHVAGKTSGQSTGYRVAIEVAALSASKRNTLLSTLNTAAGTTGIPLAEMAHYRITETGRSPNGTLHFLIAKSNTIAASVFGVWTPSRGVLEGTDRSTGDYGIGSNCLTTGVAVPYTKSYVDTEA